MCAECIGLSIVHQLTNAMADESLWCAAFATAIAPVPSAAKWCVILGTKTRKYGYTLIMPGNPKQERCRQSKGSQYASDGVACMHHVSAHLCMPKRMHLFVHRLSQLGHCMSTMHIAIFVHDCMQSMMTDGL